MAGFDEEYFLATMMFSSAADTAAGKALWGEKIERMYEKNRGLRRAIAHKLAEVDLEFPNGEVRRRFVVGYDEARLYAVVRKVIRGLYYLEQGQPFPAKSQIPIHFIQTSDDISAIEKFNDHLRPGNFHWPGIFQYRVGVVADQPSQSIWLVQFWGTHIFWAISHEFVVSP